MASEQITLPISEISSYHSRWTIKARVTGKAPIRQFNGKAGAGGKVFNVELLDKDGGEIRASFFNQAADKYFDILEIGKCFVLSRGSVKIANRQFNPCNHRYELTFDKDALVAPAADDENIKTMQFNFVELRVVQNKTLPAKVDLCGVVVAVKPAFSFKSREGKDLVKREITLADDTANSMDVTLWGERAQEPDSKFESNPVMAFKSIIVKEWNGGRSGSLLQDGVMEFNPTGPEADRIQTWWKNGGSSTSLAAMSVSGSGGGAGRNAKEVSLTELRQIAQTLPENPETYKVTARLGQIQTTKQGQKQPLSYMACSAPREGTQLMCNKRVDETGKCPVCGSMGKAVARLNTRCRFVDYADSVWCTTFHEGAEVLLGMSGDEIHALEQTDGADVEDTIKQKYYQGTPFQLTIRAKTDMYQGEAKPNISCIGARPIQREEHGKQLLAEINQMLGDGEHRKHLVAEIRHMLGDGEHGKHLLAELGAAA